MMKMLMKKTKTNKAWMIDDGEEPVRNGDTKDDAEELRYKRALPRRWALEGYRHRGGATIQCIPRVSLLYS